MGSSVYIDGALGEGGGQILRTALSLSLITGRPVRLVNIRVRRRKPGLRPQHLQAVHAAARVGRATVHGAAVDATEVEFVPAPPPVEAGRFRFDIGTAGATSLVLQTLYLPLALADSVSQVMVTGGTHVPLSPCFHYLDLHWRRFLAGIGVELSLELERAGFYPPGGGIVRMRVHPTGGLRPLTMQRRGTLRRITGISAIAGLPDHVAERQRNRSLSRLAGLAEAPCAIDTVRLTATSKGSMLLLIAEFAQTQACFFALGAPGKPAETVADEAVNALLEFVAGQAAVERYLADQLLLPLALARGESILSVDRVTPHQLTNAEVIARFIPAQIDFEGEQGKPGVIRIRGTG